MISLYHKALTTITVKHVRFNTSTDNTTCRAILLDSIGSILRVTRNENQFAVQLCTKDKLYLDGFRDHKPITKLGEYLSNLFESKVYIYMSPAWRREPEKLCIELYQPMIALGLPVVGYIIGAARKLLYPPGCVDETTMRDNWQIKKRFLLYRKYYTSLDERWCLNGAIKNGLEYGPCMETRAFSSVFSIHNRKFYDKIPYDETLDDGCVTDRVLVDSWLENLPFTLEMHGITQATEQLRSV